MSSTKSPRINYNFKVKIVVFKYYCRGLLGQYMMAMPSKDLIIVRLGEKREPNFVDVKEPEKVGHTEDIYQFIKLADKISNTTQ